MIPVALGAGLGALARHGANRLDDHRRALRSDHPGAPDRMPWATLVVNVAGSLLLGWVLASSAAGTLSPTLGAALGAGVAGGLTTYSTFAVEIVTLTREGLGGTALRYAALAVLAGTGAAALGWVLA